LSLDGKVVFATDIQGRFRQVEIGRMRIAFEPPLAGGRIFLPAQIKTASYGGAKLSVAVASDENVINLPSVSARQLCEIEFKG
jgi:hypothetical protein